MNLKTETRPCGMCNNFKKDKSANHLGICKPKLMTVVDTMLVAFKQNTCFEPINPTINI